MAISVYSCGYRTGDKAPMAYVELVDRPEVESVEDARIDISGDDQL